jgi:mannan endo-1,4-beta-mannosidase
MRRAQGVLAQFLPLIDWTSFRRRNISEEVACSDPQVQVFACADDRQAVLWLLSKSPIGTDRRLAPRAPRPVDLHVPGLSAGTYTIQPFDTVTGELSPPFQVRSDGKELPVTLELAGDLAVAVQRREGPGNGAPQASLP